MWNVERVIRLNRHQASSLILLSTNRPMSKGLTDEILKAKVEQQKQAQQQGKEEGS